MIKKVESKHKTAFNESSTHPLQSWEWGEFRKEWGNKVVRLGKFEDKKLTSTMQVISSKIPKTSYKIGTLIRGPKPTRAHIIALKELAKEENLVFIKLEPNSSKATLGTAKYKKVIELLHDNGFVKGKTLFTPTSFWIDLTLDEDKLMSSFQSKTRYNIRLANRKGVEVVEDNSEKAFEKYLELTRETVERQGFYAHTEKYHRLMWKHLHTDMVTAGNQPIARILTARYKKEIITTWILFAWHDFLYYPFGASTDKHKKVMANNLMMWEAIRYGKKLGLTTFDLWGREPGKGFTKFKEGYNPQVVEFLGTWDLPTSPLYYPYRIAESLRWALLRSRSKISPTRRSF
jgi:lipid II:glycine glycyltransferase (peptidoglycan interpeptide bridge formation enzyme)